MCEGEFPTEDPDSDDPEEVGVDFKALFQMSFLPSEMLGREGADISDNDLISLDVLEGLAVLKQIDFDLKVASYEDLAEVHVVHEELFLVEEVEGLCHHL